MHLRARGISVTGCNPDRGDVFCFISCDIYSIYGGGRNVCCCKTCCDERSSGHYISHSNSSYGFLAHPETIFFEQTYDLLQMFFIYFLLQREIPNRREILHDDQ